MLKIIAAVAVVALAVAGLAFAAGQKGTEKLSSSLKAGSEVPKPTGVPASATGSFTGKSVELANDKTKITWQLTFSHLSGKAIAAHIHLGKPGKPGGVILPLCGPCKSGQKGAGTITHAQFAKMKSGGTYVNIHTPKNTAGEIRGQVKVSDG
jgi:hypothetical protein